MLLSVIGRILGLPLEVREIAREMKDGNEMLEKRQFEKHGKRDITWETWSVFPAFCKG